MAALKRKSSEALSTPAKKPLKVKKSKDGKNPDKKKSDGKEKSKKKPDSKPVAITFPEEGKVEWNTIKKQSKMLTEARKQKKLKNSYDLIQEAKKKFEVFRNRKCKGAERDELVMECTELMKGLLSEKAKSHDVARLIQWLLKLGSKDVKNIVVDEIINDVVTLAKCKYSSHIVKNIIVTCDSSVRRKIIGRLMGNVLKLLSSKISAPILEEIYTKYSTSAEKFAIRRELYGDLCKPLIPTNQELKFSDLLQQNPALAPSILVGLKSTLTKCLDKNWLLGNPIVLTILCDYLNHCTEKDRLEMLEPLRSHMTAIIKNKVGADVGLIILKNSSAKEKKEIIKDMKGDIANIAVSPSGSVFLQHLIDSVDDTVLMKKALVPAVIENADEIITNESGRN
uniref:PUM-HD domain-containing protein n=1 Tax=Lygus hesperus TaxID=30085 RepID=A0A0A9XGJ3_LYGHE